ncbi:site-specific DNA-methyltransferase [Streptomyces bobili]|uniref:site-specific DNA-methyltransferase n=1 Tax=Streptomyces bobili TaxID=67280 RepID=UPI0022557CD2|nr:site-specific DNA-methyltransferase [Streptomyces bobili]MCX5525631.1 site-specific DNA-methyltransferase [Streptomyces bobili]
MHTVEPGDPETHSKDLVAENLEQLRKIFPSAFTEGKVDFDVLRELLGDAIEDGDEKFGLSWFGKRNARRVALKPSTATLLPRQEESVDWDTSRNIMIEGDNLEVLKLLQKSYANSVKLIYIDPPYNTGNDFIYSDSFQDSIQNYLELTGQWSGDGGRVSSNSETSGRRHSSWLDMLHPRLFLARNLLSDDGVIFVSIDDNEVHNLRAILDEIFGPENFICNLVWQKAYTANMTARFISDTHDHILLYAKDANKAELGKIGRTIDQKAKFKNPDGDPRGPWKAENLSAGKFYAAGQFEITGPTGEKFLPPPGRYWRCDAKRYAEWLADGRITFGVSGTGRPMLKKFLAEMDDGLTPSSWWRHEEFGSNKEASIELKELFDGESVFQTPKPTKLLKAICSIGAPNGGIVLDFFAGSGTTAQAVLELNGDSEDLGHRFILVQIPQEIIADSPEHKGAALFCARNNLRSNLAELTKERIRRASNLESVQGSPDRGFRNFALAESSVSRWNTSREDAEQQALDLIDNIRPGRTEFDVLFELLLSQGLDLASSVETRAFAGIHVFATGGGLLFACLPPSDAITKANAEGIAQGIIAWRDELKPEADVTVFLKDVAFADDVAKANLVAILEQHESPFVVKSL